ncbi:MAG TPA: glycosyltransferase family 4 protein [Longimicrobiales bacterium]
MKILYIVSAYDRGPGDVITPWLVETIHRLRRQDVDIEVLAPAYRGLAGGGVDGVRVHRFRYAPRRWEDLTHDQTAPDRIRERPWYLGLVPGYVAAGARAAVKLASSGGFDVVHVHWPIPHAVLGLAARRATGLPLVSSFHGVELTWTRRHFPVLVPFLRHAIRTSDAVTANSSYTASMIREVYDREVLRIPFGATVADSADVVGTDDDGTDSFELLFVGRLVERKGVRYLLDALARLDGRPGVRLRVVGDGPLRPALEAHAAALGLAGRVRFDGFVSADVLARRFAACDAFVLPAVVDAKGDTEGLGVVLVEASSHGKPVIASGVGGITDVVRDGETGILVPPADAAALAAAISALAGDPARARALGAAGRAHVDREFSWPVIIERLTSLYRGLVARTSRGRA